ncbi:MAG: hypothetical protein CVU77_08195 [Elusimicrobia bacterium HGW-Elusimicrobia-1]|jgi:hypothetical protein|nr:MAG: hypothetical protein CVU77_08195 [Elusimicrobia bacterium HGW-Elusimicrobia-1]
MIKRLFGILAVFSLFALFLSHPRPALAEGESIPPFAFEMATKFLDNPADLLFNLHSDMDDSVPVPSYRRAQVRFNLFPSFLPFAWPGLNLKVKALDETGYWPQIDVQGQYGQNAAVTVLAAAMTSTDSAKPSLYDYSVALILTKRLSDKTRIFFGPKYSYVNLQLKFDESPIDNLPGFKEFNVAQSETFLFWGLEHQTGKDRFVTSHIAYGLQYRKLMARVATSSPHFEAGMNIYPEGMFVIHPFMAWHWYF